MYMAIDLTGPIVVIHHYVVIYNYVLVVVGRGVSGVDSFI